MKENVRVIIYSAQLIGRQESGQHHPIRDLEFANELLQFGKHRTFAGHRQRCLREMLQKISKGMERRRDALFLDQSTGVKEAPFAVFRKIPFAKRKLLQWDARPDNVNFVFVATEIDD